MDFKELLSSHKLTDDSITTLIEAGISSTDTFRLITEDIIEKNFTNKLSLGQRLLLSAAVAKETKQSIPPTDVLPGATGTTLTADDIAQLTGQGSVLNSLLNNLPETKVSQPKARDICDFLALKTNKESPNVKVGDFELKLRDGTKPKLDGVSPAQYLEASMKILLDIIANEGMTMVEVVNHVEYLAKIGSFAQGFAWNSVLNYDAEFRRIRAEKSRPWNTDDTFLMQLHLRSRQQHSDRPAMSSSKSAPKASVDRRNKFDPNTGSPICEKFNGKYGCNFANCRYSHVCMSCFAKEHNEFTHKGDSKKGQ